MPERVENSMVVDGWWDEVEYGVKRGACPEPEPEGPGERGWVEMGTGLFIPEEDAFGYAIRKLRLGRKRKSRSLWSFFIQGIIFTRRDKVC